MIKATILKLWKEYTHYGFLGHTTIKGPIVYVLVKNSVMTLNFISFCLSVYILY